MCVVVFLTFICDVKFVRDECVLFDFKSSVGDEFVLFDVASSVGDEMFNEVVVIHVRGRRNRRIALMFPIIIVHYVESELRKKKANQSMDRESLLILLMFHSLFEKPGR